MEKAYQLKARQVCFIIIAFMPVSKFFMMNSVIASYSKNDMWISTLINLILELVSIIAILYCAKKVNKTFIEILEEKFGKTVTKIILFIFFLYFIIKAIIPITEQKDYIILTLYISMPNVLFFIPFFFASYYFCCQKLRALGRIADLCWYFTLVGYIMLVSLSVSNADYSAFLPINYNNTAGIFSGAYHSLNWFGDSVYLLFLIGNFKWEKKCGIKIILSYLLTFFMILFFSFLFYCIFTSIAFRQRFAMTEISKYSTIISNTGRFDYVGIAIILFMNIFSLSLPLFFASRLLSYIFSIKKKWIAPLLVNGGILLTMLLTSNVFYFVEKFILDYMGYFFLTVSYIVPLSLPLIIKGVKKNELY